MVVTNSYKSEEIKISAEKVWVGGEETTHTAPEFILYQNGQIYTESIATITPGEGTSNTFNYEWTVPKTDEFGQDYLYTVDEVQTPEGYGKSIKVDEGTGKTTITNTFDAKVTDISVHKDWIGGSDYPAITFELQRRVGNDEFVTVATEVLPTGDHIHIWKDQALTNDQNQDYEYRVRETKIGDTEVVEDKALTHSVSYSGTVAEGFTVTNTSDNALEIPITKVWVDDDNAKETRPTKITFTAVREDGVKKSQVFDVNEENKYVIEGLEKYKPNSTEEYKYTIEEVQMGDYQATVDGTTVTNTLQKTTEINFKKTWIGGPDTKPEVTINLQRNGEQAVTVEGKEVEPIILTEGQTTGSFKDLPVYDENGAEIQYDILETHIDGVPVENEKAGNYEVKIEGNTITNTFVMDEISFTGEKAWGEGPEDRPEVGFQLYRRLENEAEDLKKAVGPPVAIKGEGYTWEKLPRANENNVKYVYSVDEPNVPAGYEKSIQDPVFDNLGNGSQTIKNTFIIEIQLYRKVEGGELEKVEGMKLLTDGDVTVTWTVPRTNEKGEQYLYSVNEVNVPANFNESYSDDGLKVTNTYISPKKSLEVTKVWDGGPEEKPAVFLQLMKNGQKEGEKITLDPETNTHIWQDLDINDQNGVAYKYSVVEDPMDLYKPVITENENGFTITNHYTTDTGEVTGVKKWVGEPEDKPAIDLVLLQNNEPYQAEGILNPRTVSKSSNWTTTWTNLPITDKDGKEYLYSVDEVETPKGYEKSYGDDGRTVINTYLQELTDIKATKEWVGGPKDKPNVELQLMRDGVAVGDPVPLTDTNSHTWEDQPVQDENGKAYIYSVTEVAVPEGYQLEVKGNIQTGFTLTNTFEKTTEITIEKIWKDENANTRPDILIFMAVRNDGEIIRKVFDRNNMDKYIIDGLAIYDENGEEYSYQVDEATVPGYAKSIEGNTITNTLTDKTDINVRKIWKGVDNPADYKGTFQLYANDQLVEGKTLEINGDGTGAFKDLDAFDKEGAPIRYDVKEILIPDGFETEKVENGICGCDYVFTNTLTTEKMDLSVEKEWVGEDETRPSITLRLMDGNNQVAFVVLEPGQTKYTFSNLEKYRKDGSEITYTLREDPVEGYTSKIEGLKVTNTKIEAPVIEPETVDVKGEKVWIGGEAEKPTIQLQLMQNGKAFKEPVNLTNGNTEYLWTGLPKLDDAGKAYKYTVDEVAVPEGYEKVPYEGTVVINKAKTEEPTLETTTVVGTKIWINTTGERPEVQLQLKRNGSNYLDPVTLKDGASEAIWKDLPLKDEKNDLYNYTVDEITVPAGYTKEVINGRIIVNTKTEEPVTETINFTGNKIWLGGPVAKPNIELILLQNGVKIGESVVLKSGENAATWNDLPRLDESGAPYKYSVDEKSVPTDYKKILYPSIPNTVFNEYQKSEEPSVTENISIKGTKVWLDGPKDKPDIQLILLRNGVKVGEAVSLTKGQTVYEWINLPKTDEKGKDYVYTVDEVNVPQGYEKILAGTTVINKYKSVEEPKDLIDITGKKVWVGGPEEKPAIQLQLKQNGKNYGEPVTLDGKTEHKWTNLPKKDAEGKDYSYTVDEVEVPKDYTKKVSGMTVTNTHDSIEETTDLIDITGKKVWVGGPEEKPVIQLQLKQNDKNYGEPVTLDGKTEHKWTNLPKKDAEGKEYSYTVDEVEVPKDYTKKVSGTTVTNTHKTVKESNATNNVVNRGSNTRYQPVSSGGYGQSKPAYYPAEIPKTSDPMVFWGLMSGALAVLLGTTTIIAKKKEEKDE